MFGDPEEEKKKKRCQEPFHKTVPGRNGDRAHLVNSGGTGVSNAVESCDVREEKRG
jgi:hypothetical protein